MLKNKLANVDIFRSLDEETIDEIVSMSTLRTLAKGNVLFYEGEEPQAFYVLLEGHLKLYKTGPKYQEVVLHYFVSPTLIAEMATLEDFNFPATAMAMKDDTLIAVIDKERFTRMLKSDAHFSYHIIRSLTRKIKTLEVAISRNLILDATAKVCSLLRENPTVLIDNRNAQVASILNMTPETLSRTLGKLKKLNIIDNEYNVLDSEKLDMFLEL